MEFPVRINKYLAEKKIASRREADALISDKKVFINGVPAVLGQKVEKSDEVTVTGNTKKYRYIAYYKPRGVISHSPGADEEDILMRIHKDHDMSGVYPIGRLDKDSEGLILLTNDGRITKELLEPENKKEKEYEVKVDKPVKKQFLGHLEKGVNIEEYRTKPAKTESVDKHTFRIILTEGKKHQIRRMCAALGYQVKHLKRIRIANVTLGSLKEGMWRNIAGEEKDAFLASVGL